MKREIINEGKKLRVCRKHSKPVYFDGAICPACSAQKEWIHLTKDLK